MRFSLTTLFDLGELPADLRRSLGLVYASSLLVIMGVNIVQQVLPAMIEPLGITDADVGLVIAVYTAPAIVLAPLIGIAADRYGRRPLLAGGLLLFGVAGTAVAFAPSFGWVLALRVVQGVGFSAVIPLTIVLIGDLLEGHREVSGQGLKVFIDRVGELVLPPLGGALALVGWRWPFLSYAAAVPLGLLVVAWMPETRGTTMASPGRYLKDVARVVRNPRLLLAFAAGFLRFFLDYGFFTYLPLFLVRTHGLSTAGAGLLRSFHALGAMVTSSQAGRLAASWDKGSLVLCAFIVSGLALLAVSFAPGTGTMAPVLILYGLANGVISPMQKSLLTQNAPLELRGGVISLDRLTQQVAKTAGVSGIGLLLGVMEMPTLFRIMAVLSFVSVGLMAPLALSARDRKQGSDTEGVR